MKPSPEFSAMTALITLVIGMQPVLTALARELEAADFKIDWNKVMR
jgi:hypothetical protein